MITITKPLLLAFRAVRRDERGAGLVELALIAPMLAVLTVGIVDLTQGVTRRMQLHDAAHRTLEKVAARNFKLDLKSDGEPDTVLIEAEAEAAAGPGSKATVYSWLECDGEEQPKFSSKCPPLENPDPGCTDPSPPVGANCEPILARYIRITVESSFRPTFGTFVAPEKDGTFPLWAEAAVRVQ
jgi:Flp pilus assembly pilin Flp